MKLEENLQISLDIKENLRLPKPP